MGWCGHVLGCAALALAACGGRTELEVAERGPPSPPPPLPVCDADDQLDDVTPEGPCRWTLGIGTSVVEGSGANVLGARATADGPAIVATGPFLERRLLHLDDDGQARDASRLLWTAPRSGGWGRVSPASIADPCSPRVLFWETWGGPGRDSVDRCHHAQVHPDGRVSVDDLGPDVCADLRPGPAGFSLLSFPPARDEDALTWVDLGADGVPVASEAVTLGGEPFLVTPIPARRLRVPGGWLLHGRLGREDTLVRLGEGGRVVESWPLSVHGAMHDWAAQNGRRWLAWLPLFEGRAGELVEVESAVWHVLEVDEGGPRPGPVRIDLGRELGPTGSAHSIAVASGGLLWLTHAARADGDAARVSLVGVRPDGEIVSGPHVFDDARSPTLVGTRSGALLMYSRWTPDRGVLGVSALPVYCR